MKAAIMQPYVFPYVGYFQLINSVDLFIFYNDVNFIKKGWINRNRILVDNKDFLLTIPCADVSQNKKINEVRLAISEKEMNRLLSTISHAYKKAPEFQNVWPIIESVLTAGHEFVDQLAIDSVLKVSEYLGMQKKFKESKGLYGNEHLKKADRLIDICLRENKKEYVNPMGGIELYSKDYFADRGIELFFLKHQVETYRQFDITNFVAGLSIIDVLMFNSAAKVNTFLKNFELI